jgi:hypothetical protein
MPSGSEEHKKQAHPKRLGLRLIYGGVGRCARNPPWQPKIPNAGTGTLLTKFC